MAKRRQGREDMKLACLAGTQSHLLKEMTQPQPPHLIDKERERHGEAKLSSTHWKQWKWDPSFLHTTEADRSILIL